MNSTLQLFESSQALKPWIQHIGIGRDAALEQQLVTKSRQPHILKFTPNDAGSRFKDLATLEQRWNSQKREYVWLIGPENDLAGIIWFGPKPFPLDLKLPEHPTDTFAIRLYENYLGKGLAKPFLEQALSIEHHRRLQQGEAPLSIWGETDTTNPAAIATYDKIGFRHVDTTPDRVTMVLPSATIDQISAKFPALNITNGESK